MTNIPSTPLHQSTVCCSSATKSTDAKTMTQDCGAKTQASVSKIRKKRRWDQPDESLVSCGAVLSGMLPMSTVGCSGISLPGAVSGSCTPSTSSMKVGCVNIQASVVQHHAAALVHRLTQPKIQEDLIIAREIVINDADSAMRYKLTKRQTQEEIQKSSGAVVITRGKYRPTNAVPDGEKPLYLHISAGAHLKETAERILAVDRAAAMVEDMLKQVSQPLSTCIYLGFDADPSLNIVARIRGPNDQYINHIMNETGATIVLHGRGSGHLGVIQDEEGQQPLYLLLSSNNQKSLDDAKLLAENLLDTISRECGANRVSSCKVYGAVPPPQQLLVGVQSPGTEMHANLSSAASMACSAATSIPDGLVASVVGPVVPTTFSYGQVIQPGLLLPPGPAQKNGLHYSQPSLTACTSYSAYAGIYPQATCSQQVALALRQSSPVSSTVHPATSATMVMPKSSFESEKRKRKFQESPAAFKGVAVSQQESDLRDPCMEKKKKDTTMPPPSLKNMLPPPPPRNNSTISLNSRSMPHPPKSMLPSPSPSKSMHPLPPSSNSMHPPLPKFDSSVSVNRGNDRDNIAKRSSLPTVSDTLVKLMEYGDDDDDVEESENEISNNSANRVATSKPFWAV
ncbi:protein RIK isoform X2 [Spinacia oleracea]|uniref:Protein RIK isoform X2 n=1 Tax=Spinacia oleracea TaxID=3562 RepID=A0A9R0K301_SPIOL|nr:protein RIK isoform X2 [Spinacia oleracea]